MVKRKQFKLTDLQCRNAPDGSLGDGNGLSLLVGKGGIQKSWVWRGTLDGTRVMRGLGGFPDVTLAEARQVAAALKAGAKPVKTPAPDPHAFPASSGTATAAILRHTTGETDKPSAPTFREVAETVIDLRAPTWSSPRHAKQWHESLTKHVYPTLGNRRISEITSADVLAVLTPIWNSLPETSTRVKQRMGVIFDYAIAAESRTDNPVAAVGRALPRRPRLKAHHPALAYADVPDALELIRTSTADASTRLALEFAVLCASRANEVRGARWSEIDGDTWVVPADRMKGRAAHRVPLSDRAMAILAEAMELAVGKPDPDTLIFPNKRSGKPLSNMAFSSLLKRLEIDAVPHGFRSSFRDWSMETTATPWAVCERSLAHKLGGAEVEAYARGDLFQQRRTLMQAWADYVCRVDN